MATPTTENSNTATGKVNYGSRSPSNEPPTSYTVEEAIETLGFGWFQIKIILIGAIIWVADAAEVMILAVFSPIAKCEWELNAWQEALISTVVFLGMMVGSPIEGRIVDKYGRRAGMILLYFYLFFFGLLSAFSPSYGWILFLRFLVGFTIGGLVQTMTVISEFSPNDKRAVSFTIVQSCWFLGTSYSVLLALTVIPNLGWRWFLILASIPAVLLVALLYFFLPETPQYLLQSGKPNEAIKVLRRIARDNGKRLPQGELKSSSPQQEAEDGTIFDLFSHEFCRSTILFMFLWFFVFVLYYGIILFTTQMLLYPESCHGKFSAVESLQATTCACKTLSVDNFVHIIYTSLAEIPGTIIAMILADELGRKKAMAIITVVIASLYFLMCICPGSVGMMVLLFTIRGMTLGFTTLLFVYTSEVFPTKVRGVSIGLFNSSGRVGAMVTPFIAQVIMEHSARMSMVVYASMALLCLVALFLLPTEPPRPVSWIRKLCAKTKD